MNMGNYERKRSPYGKKEVRDKRTGEAGRGTTNEEAFDALKRKEGAGYSRDGWFDDSSSWDEEVPLSPIGKLAAGVFSLGVLFGAGYGVYEICNHIINLQVKLPQRMIQQSPEVRIGKGNSSLTLEEQIMEELPLSHQLQQRLQSWKMPAYLARGLLLLSQHAQKNIEINDFAFYSGGAGIPKSYIWAAGKYFDADSFDTSINTNRGGYISRLKTIDRGRPEFSLQWQSAGDDEVPHGIYCFNFEDVLAIAPLGILHTSNGGEKWEWSYRDNECVLGYLYIFDRQRIAAERGGGSAKNVISIVYTMDGGKNWIPTPAHNHYTLRLDDISEALLLTPREKEKLKERSVISERTSERKIVSCWDGKQ